MSANGITLHSSLNELKVIKKYRPNYRLQHGYLALIVKNSKKGPKLISV